MAAKPTKIATFVWQGKDKAGKKKKGEMQSASAALVKAELRKQGILATKVSKKSLSLSLGGGGKVNPMDIALFTRQMATMMKAGVPLLQAFDITAGGIEKESEIQLQDKNEVVTVFADSLRQHPEYLTTCTASSPR